MMRSKMLRNMLLVPVVLGAVGGAVLGGAPLIGASPALAQGYPPVPPLQFEPAPPPPPGPPAGWLWEPGHWRWGGARYIWVGGHYIARQPGWTHFVHGHWNRFGRWIPGHWV